MITCAVGGGKGGIGKSLITSSLAIALANSGKKVIAIDLDLGGANLHTTLGLEMPKATFSDFVFHSTNTLESCITPTPITNLFIVSGAQDALKITELNSAQIQKTIHAISELSADICILDLGAGTSEATLEFFNSVQFPILVALPEPTSIENAYRFIKSSYYSRILKNTELEAIRSLVNATKTPADLYRETQRLFPQLLIKLKSTIENFKPSLIINQVRSQSDSEIGHSIKTVSKKYFGIDIQYLGHLDFDSAVWQAIRKRRPLFTEFPNSKIVSELRKMAEKIYV